MRDGEKGEEREAKQGGGAGVCLQGCVIQPGRFCPCCDHTHPKTPVHKGRAGLLDKIL